MAAHSSKAQWHRYLQGLVADKGLSLTFRQAWTALNEQFGVDVDSSDRAWVKTVLGELVDAARRPWRDEVLGVQQCLRVHHELRVDARERDAVDPGFAAGRDPAPRPASARPRSASC